MKSDFDIDMSKYFFNKGSFLKQHLLLRHGHSDKFDALVYVLQAIF